MKNDPRTTEQWQQAVDIASGARMIADSKMYGLIQGGPAIDVARCDEILERGRKRGVRPSRPVLDLAMDLLHSINPGLSGYAQAGGVPPKRGPETETGNEN